MPHLPQRPQSTHAENGREPCSPRAWGWSEFEYAKETKRVGSLQDVVDVVDIPFRCFSGLSGGTENHGSGGREPAAEIREGGKGAGNHL